MTQLEIITKLKEYLEANLPAVLTADSLSQFQKYLKTYPSDPEQRQCAVYIAEGSEGNDARAEAFLVQLQLPGITDPAPYLSAVWPVFVAYDPEDIGFIDKVLSHLTWYPGEPGTNGSSSLIYIEIKFTKPKDDCEG